MSDLRELYLEMVTDHAKNPRNRGKADPCHHIGTGHNPLCGDKIVVTLSVDGDIITNVKFDGEGCAISTASADLMAEVLQGKTLAETKHLFKGFHALVTGTACAETPGELTQKGKDPTSNSPKIELPKKLSVFSGVREFPLRVKCATLAWHTVIAAFENSEIATTE